VLENIATDIPTVFRAGSPQAQEVASNPGQAFADFAASASTVHSQCALLGRKWRRIRFGCR